MPRTWKLYVNYDQDLFELYLTINGKEYTYYDISPYKYGKFKQLLRRNFGRAMAYIKRQS